MAMGLRGLCSGGEGFLVDGLPAARLVGDRSRRAIGERCVEPDSEFTTNSSPASPKTLGAAEPLALAPLGFRTPADDFCLGTASSDTLIGSVGSIEEPLDKVVLLLPPAVCARVVPVSFRTRAAVFFDLLRLPLPSDVPLSLGDAGGLSPTGDPRSRSQHLSLKYIYIYYMGHDKRGDT